MFSLITYTAAIVSIIGTVCLTQPSTSSKSKPGIELIYEIEKAPKEEYYNPVYILPDGDASVAGKPSTFKPILLTDIYQSK